MNTLLITQQEELNRFCTQLSGSEHISIDTEFVRESTYFPLLGLIQVATHDLCACIDPLSDLDLHPFVDLLDDKNITKVFHACRQDLEIFLNEFGRLPVNIFDTQVAAPLLGHAEQIGYANLVKEVTGTDLEKSQSRTDWLRRPLSEKQIEYAANDVIYLSRVYTQQVVELTKLGRLNWLDSDCRELENKSLYRPDDADLWRKVKGVQRLRGVEVAIVQEIAAWREQQAISRNKPRKRILADDAIIQIGAAKPDSENDFATIRSFKNKSTQALISDLFTCVQRASERPQDDWPKQVRRKKPTARQDALVDVLMSVVKLCASQHKLHASTLCNRKDLETLVLGSEDIPLMKGWRLDHAGAEVRQFLGGAIKLYFNEGIGLVLE